MTKKSIYTSSELPDEMLQEFEEVQDAFLILIANLAKKYDPRAIHAGMSRAHLALIKLGAGDNLKQILMNTADYFLKQAEKVKEEV